MSSWVWDLVASRSPASQAPSSTPTSTTTSRTPLVEPNAKRPPSESARSKRPSKPSAPSTDRTHPRTGREQASSSTGRGAVLQYGDDPRRRNRAAIGRLWGAFGGWDGEAVGVQP
jgi:hypothetical protein